MRPKLVGVAPRSPLARMRGAKRPACPCFPEDAAGRARLGWWGRASGDRGRRAAMQTLVAQRGEPPAPAGSWLGSMGACGGEAWPSGGLAPICLLRVNTSSTRRMASLGAAWPGSGGGSSAGLLGVTTGAGRGRVGSRPHDVGFGQRHRPGSAWGIAEEVTQGGQPQQPAEALVQRHAGEPGGARSARSPSTR
jgi:hypothetical protein